MSSFEISMNAVLPMFLLIVLGILLRRKNCISIDTQSQLNNLIHDIFIPCLLMKNIYNTSVGYMSHWKLMCFAILSILMMWLASTLFVLRIESRNSARGAMIQGMCRSNYTLFGLAILMNLYGNENIGISSFLVAIIMPLYNILAIITFEILRGKKIDIKHLIVQLIKNPFILAILIGLLFKSIEIQLPIFIHITINNISALALPLAMIIMGASLESKKAIEEIRNIIIVVLGKLLIIPLIFLPIAVAIGFREIELASLLVIFASPTSIVSYAVAGQMGGDSDMASSIVITTTLFSCVTVLFWIFSAMQLNLI